MPDEKELIHGHWERPNLIIDRGTFSARAPMTQDNAVILQQELRLIQDLLAKLIDKS